MPLSSVRAIGAECYVVIPIHKLHIIPIRKG
jgi:hypothetical protein